jgi:hypothetical protein
MRELESKIEHLEGQLTEKQWGLDETTDPRIRGLIQEQKRMRDEFDTILRSVSKTDEDEKLEPFMQRVLDEHPELERAYPNRIKRLEAMRTMARGYEAQALSKSSVSGGRKEFATPARVHLTGGGPSASRRPAGSDDWSEFQRKMADPKLSSDEKKALADKYDRDHPEE